MNLKEIGERLRATGVNGGFGVDRVFEHPYDSTVPHEYHVIGYGKSDRKWDIAICKFEDTAQIIADLLNLADQGACK